MTSELAALRWGDVQQIQITPTGPQEGTNVFTLSKQLVSANWRVPMSWNVLLFAVPNVSQADTGTLTVNWLFSLGGGQGASTTIPLFTMGPFNKTVTAVQQQQQLVPSSNLQIQAQVLSVLNSTNTSSIYLGAFVAPNNAEPFGERDMMRLMVEQAGIPEEHLRDMQMGFSDEGMLSYRR